MFCNTRAPQQDSSVLGSYKHVTGQQGVYQGAQQLQDLIRFYEVWDMQWLAWGDYAEAASKTKAAGIQLIVMVNSAEEAVKAVELGADVVVAQVIFENCPEKVALLCIAFTHSCAFTVWDLMTCMTDLTHCILWSDHSCHHSYL